MVTFKVNPEAVGVLSMLEQEPGAAVGLLTCSAGIGSRFLLTCDETEKGMRLEEILHQKYKHHDIYFFVKQYLIQNSIRVTNP